MAEIPDLPLHGSERNLLEAFLDYHRALLRHKAVGLSNEQLHATVASSSLTLGGLLNHMAFVEQDWFVGDIAGDDVTEPWISAPWSEDPDWEFSTASDLPADEIFRRYDESIMLSRNVMDGVTDLNMPSVARHRRRNEHWSVRWVLIHMIEEYARHCGHADIIREAIDGQVGDFE